MRCQLRQDFFKDYEGLSPENFVVFHTRQAMEKQLSYVRKELQKTRDKAMIGACLWRCFVLFASACSDREKTDVDGKRWL